jgi:hypothetical protein
MMQGGNPEGARLKRESETRLRTAEAEARRRDAERSANLERRTREFYESSATFLSLARENCAVDRDSLELKTVRKSVSARARKIDNLLAKIIPYLNDTKGRRETLPAMSPQQLFEAFCRESDNVVPQLDELIRASKSGIWNSELANESALQLHGLRNIVKGLKKL